MGEFRYGLIIGVLIAAVIALALVVVLDSDDSGSPKEPDSERPIKVVNITQQPEENDSTPAADAPSAETAGPEWAFRSPTGNIVCAVSSQSATCGIREFDYPVPTKPVTCNLAGWGQFLGVKKIGYGEMLCSDGIPADPLSPVLDYGTSVQSGPFECTSSESGVRCRNTQTGHGFNLSREAFSTF